jgi:hypothetical protein
VGPSPGGCRQRPRSEHHASNEDEFVPWRTEPRRLGLVSRSERNSNFPLARIGSESGPPNLATETNATSCPRSARNPPSPVRIQRCSPPTTPKAREFLEWSRVAVAKSLQPQTRWRWGESSANPSLGAESLLSREDTGNSVDPGPIETCRGSEEDWFPATFGGISLEPGTGKDDTAIREFVGRASWSSSIAWARSGRTTQHRRSSQVPRGRAREPACGASGSPRLGAGAPAGIMISLGLLIFLDSIGISITPSWIPSAVSRGGSP